MDKTILNIAVKLILSIVVVISIITITNNKFNNLRTYDYNNQVATLSEREKQLQCLAKNIYFEAASEPFEGKVAVAQVTMNRVNSGKFPSDVCQVVYQKNVVYDKVICQFSWFCENGPALKVRSKEMYEESMEVAKKVLLENFRLPSLHGALYYHADYVNPKWNKPKIAKIGRHIFYGDRT